MRSVVGFLLLSVCFGCQHSDHVGYDRLFGNVHYKHIKLGDDDIPVQQGSRISGHMKVYTDNDSLLARKSFIRWDAISSLGATHPLARCLATMVEGDSTAFMGTAGAFDIFNHLGVTLEDTSRLCTLHISLFNVMSEMEYKTILLKDKARYDLDMKEQKQLDSILRHFSIPRDRHIDHMYYQNLKTGTGRRPKSGNTVFVNYRAYFANGTKFDDTYQANEPLEYIIGKPDQVLPGFATGVSQMREKGRARFVIPSVVGFGESGSSSGIVPPFSTLIYEVELSRVQD